MRADAVTTSNSEPARAIDRQAIAGLAMRLVQRFDVRHEPTKASPAAATIAPHGPCISSSRKMKISPATNEFFECGTRTGKKPASIAIAVAAATCCSADGSIGATFRHAIAKTVVPSATAPHQ